MKVVELEQLARIVHRTGDDELREFVNRSLDEGDLGIHYHEGVKKQVRRIMAGGE